MLLWVALAFWIVINGALFEEECTPTVAVVEHLLRARIGAGLIEPTLSFAAELFCPAPKINPRTFLQHGKKEQKKKEPWLR